MVNPVEVITTQSQENGRLDASPATAAWLRRLYDAVDAMDAVAFAAFFTKDGRLDFANQPALEGPDAIREGIGAFFDTIQGIKHAFRNAWDVGDGAVVFECWATYTRHDDAEVTVPATVVFERDGERITHMRIYVDLAPLYQ